jgi:hypothetical protein
MSDTKGKWTREAFERHHTAHPEIYNAFCRFALEAATRRPYFSARAVYQRIRWETMITEGKDFKIDDGWCSHYARKFMREHAQCNNFFRTKVSKYHPDGGDYYGV